jgi:NhaP-type Na+/H+ or K+/H+ antiporter
MSRLRREGAAIRRLITLGALITLIGGAIAAHVWIGFGEMESLLFGALVIVTGPTVVGPLVSELRLKKRVSTVLEAEGVLIDPIGAILAVVILGLALSGDPGSLVLAQSGAGLARVAAGMVFGVGAGFLLARALRISRLLPEGLQNVFVLSSVLLLYAGAEGVLSHSGVLAVTRMFASSRSSRSAGQVSASSRPWFSSSAHSASGSVRAVRDSSGASDSSSPGWLPAASWPRRSRHSSRRISSARVSTAVSSCGPSSS